MYYTLNSKGQDAIRHIKRAHLFEAFHYGIGLLGTVVGIYPLCKGAPDMKWLPVVVFVLCIVMSYFIRIKPFLKNVAELRKSAVEIIVGNTIELHTISTLFIKPHIITLNPNGNIALLQNDSKYGQTLYIPTDGDMDVRIELAMFDEDILEILSPYLSISNVDTSSQVLN